MLLILIRHGESDHNVEGLFDSDIHSTSMLTKNGINDIKLSSKKVLDFLRNSHNTNVNRIFCSPLYRTVETAKYFEEIIKSSDLYRDDRLCLDYRLKEINMGNFNRKKISDYPYGPWNFDKNNEFGGETSNDVKNRIIDFYKQLNKFNTNVIVSHGEPLRQLYWYVVKQVLKKSNFDIKPKKSEPIIINLLTETISIL